jgi:hypothetical protein
MRWTRRWVDQSGRRRTAGKPAKHKLVTEYHGENEKTFTMYQQDEKGGDDAWQKTMEIKYTRRK